ncbi:MAG TPA: Tm-1-like ATP-binding domain-containing protein [Syntrophobacteraceae bacterium]|nr:Tm-1-like ATP-binding domain-containing protein [Syntrophobacteraceae bacterium]
MAKQILIIGTLDTKGGETLYLRSAVEALGLTPILMDISLRGSADSPAEITPALVATAAGSSLQEITGSQQRSHITNVTIAGASKIARQLLEEGRLDGVIAIGGSTGSLMATDVMRALPFGVPKIMVSSTAALPGLSTRYIDTGDIALFHSVIEISGLSNMLKNVIDRAACALQGMVSDHITSPRAEEKCAIALTMLGPCEKCASAVRAELEKAGYQVIGFSAAGVCDRAMEKMISQGFFQGVVDLAPGGVGEHLFGFMRDAGPDRMESAGRKGIPQIISTCSVNYMTPAKSRYTPEYHQRRKYDLDKLRTWIRLSPDELRQVARAFAEKLNKSTGPTLVMIPLKGWSSLDVPGSPTFDLNEDKVFIDELQVLLKPEIKLSLFDANMEEPEFALALARAAQDLFRTSIEHGRSAKSLNGL